MLTGYEPGKLEFAVINKIRLKHTLQVISTFNAEDILKSLKRMILIAQINLKSSCLDLGESSSTDQMRPHYCYIDYHFWGTSRKVHINHHYQSLPSGINQ